MPLIIPANTLSGGYEIENSLRYNEADDSKLVFDPADDDNKRTFTFSFWMKPAVGDYGGDHNNVFSVRPSAGSYNMLVHRTGGEFLIEINGTGDVLKTNRLFRDPSAWYHIVMAIDTTDGTASNRVKFYVNGTEETSFATDNRSNLSQNTDMLWGGAQPHQIGGDPTGNYFYGGHLAEINFVTGSQLAPSSFGETNDNGVWIPKKFAGSHGTNGFFLEFKQTGTSANASGIGADTSGNDNHYAVTNLASTDITTDTPTNNFCTWNPLANYFTGSTFSEGNCYLTMADSVATFNTGTFGLTSGKWYWETKVINIGSGSDNFLVGIVSRSDSTGTSDYLGESTSVVFRNNGNIKKDSGNATHGASYGVNDIVMVALDCDNNNIYFGENGQWADGSGNTDESSPNSAVSFTSTMISDGIVFPAQGDLHGNTPNPIASTNFGNAPHSISSGNSDGAGFGNFEYEVPSGYYALCTKNLAEYG